MTSKVQRRHRVRRGAWAVLVALVVPAADCRADEGPSYPVRGPERGLLSRVTRVFRHEANALPEAAPRTSPAAPGAAPGVRFRGQSPGRPDEPAAGAVEFAAPPLPQLPGTGPQTPGLPDATLAALADDDVRPAGCASCGGFHRGLDAPAFHGAVMGCAGGSCVPGQAPCPVIVDDCSSTLAKFFANIYQCLCCPDPCYEPRWVPAANASFFADYARPRTVTRIRYDNLNNMQLPDRNQFFLKALPVQTRGGRPFIKNGVQYLANPSARLQQVSLYQEAAGERGSFFIQMDYRQINPLYTPTQAGFADMSLGTKSLLFDCELLQVAFQFRTFLPTGNAANALGTGHVSLDPSILTTLKLAEGTYLQGQYGNWIPLGGTSPIAGGIFYWFTSLNQQIWEPLPNSPLIATFEFDGWSFENGGYTQPIAVKGKSHVRSSGGGVSYFNLGPGLRWSICNRMDIGGAVTFATSEHYWADPYFRFEVRFLF